MQNTKQDDQYQKFAPNQRHAGLARIAQFGSSLRPPVKLGIEAVEKINLVRIRRVGGKCDVSECSVCDNLMLGKGQEALENHPGNLMTWFFYRFVSDNIDTNWRDYLRCKMVFLSSKIDLLCRLVLSLLLWVVFSTNSYGAGLCTEKDATLGCLKEHSSELYSTNTDLFWKILNGAASKANKCNSKNATADFLSLVQITRGGELAEYFSKNIENLCVSNTKCFLDALMLLKPFDKDRIIYELNNSVFKEQRETTEALSKYKNNSKYKRVIDLYMQKFRRNNNLKIE